MSHARRQPILTLALLLAVWGGTGCAWLNQRRAPKRADSDPLLMSHLTHGKHDPLFAKTENALDFDSPTRFASSTSKKPNDGPSPSAVGSATSDAQEQSRRRLRECQCGRADDFRWVVGQLAYHESKGWSIRYAPAGVDKQFNGELPLTSSFRPGVLRVGDQVMVEGRVVHVGLDGYRYKVESIELVTQP